MTPGPGWRGRMCSGLECESPTKEALGMWATHRSVCTWKRHELVGVESWSYRVTLGGTVPPRSSPRCRHIRTEQRRDVANARPGAQHTRSSDKQRSGQSCCPTCANASPHSRRPFLAGVTFPTVSIFNIITITVRKRRCDLILTFPMSTGRGCNQSSTFEKLFCFVLFCNHPRNSRPHKC